VETKTNVTKVERIKQEGGRRMEQERALQLCIRREI
jgi:hypothetical protein